jgi:hypothetical protein
MPSGLFNPEMRVALTVAPEVVYSPMALEPKFETNRFEPATRMPNESFSPDGTSAAFTVAPDVVYSPTVPPTIGAQDATERQICVANRFEPETAMAIGGGVTPEMSAAFTVAPEVVYSPIDPNGIASDAGKRLTTNRFEPDPAIPCGLFSPR